jgi:hypothetical protein
METEIKAPPFALELSYSQSVPLENEFRACASSQRTIPTTIGPRLSFAERTRRMAKIRIEPEYIDPVTAGVVTPDEMDRKLAR